jgi:hypothetical protein
MIKIISVCAILTIAAGCNVTSMSASKQDFCYIDKQKLYSTASVAFIELYNESEYTNVQVEVTDELYHAIMKKQLFTLNLIKQNAESWKSIDYHPGSKLTLEQLYQLQQSLNTKAILLGTVTDFKPYPHLLLAMKLDMLDINDGRTIWAAEQVWDAADKNLEQRVKKYIQSQMRTDRTADRDKLTFISTKDFIKFVCYELAETMKTN